MARSFVQLNLDERRIIARMHEKKISQAEIARALRRDRSTICGELSHDRQGQSVRSCRSPLEERRVHETRRQSNGLSHSVVGRRRLNCRQ
jgi:IS30 family transposase